MRPSWAQSYPSILLVHLSPAPVGDAAVVNRHHQLKT